MEKSDENAQTHKTYSIWHKHRGKRSHKANPTWPKLGQTPEDATQVQRRTAVHTTGKSKISVGGNETDKKIYFILSVRENRQENYKTDRKMVNVLSVYVTDRKIGNTLSVFLVHTGKIIYFLSGTDYFCRYFFNTQENYEKKSTRQNLAQSEHPAPSENPKNPVQRQKEKKRPTART